jgi:hypothetical protein
MGSSSASGEEAMLSSRSAGGVAFVVLSVVVQLLTASVAESVRRKLVWVAVALLATVVLAAGLVASAADRIR